MFCPNCGKSEQIPKSYCRNCGEWLTNSGKKNQSGFDGQTPQDNIRLTLFLNFFSAIAGFGSAIALYATFLGRENTPMVVYAVAAFCLCIGIWQVSNIYTGLKLRSRFNAAQNKEDDTLPELAAGEAKQDYVLPPADTQEFIKPFSVTEDDTKILDKLPRK
jgi:hypothetical protein